MSDSREQLADAVRRESGIDLGSSHHGALAAAVSRVAPGASPTGFLRRLSEAPNGPVLLDRLIDEVSVNETFFFRQATSLAARDWPALLALASQAHAATVSVWVAGCSTGDEAYTLALLACEAFAPEPAPVTILATDISSDALALAEQGLYGARAVRGVRSAWRERYFTVDGNRLAVSDQLRGMVRFMRHNLVHDAFPPAGAGLFDLITCRNTLIYFESATVDQVICSLRGALKPAGTLLLGAADRISTSTRLFPPGDGVVRARRPPTTAPERDRAGRAAARGHDRPASSPVEAPSANPQSGLAAALSAANAGHLDRAVELIEPVLAADPMDSRALFIRGLVELASGDATAAVTSLRRVLYVRPDFGLAGFKLGEALERSGAIDSAAQAYRQALRTLGNPNPQAVAVDHEIASADIALACRMRLRALGSTDAPHGNGAANGARA